MVLTNNILIIAHGDLDGIIGALALCRKLNISPSLYNITFIQPFLLHQIQGKYLEKKDIYVVDIAPNNKDFYMTKDFLLHYNCQIKEYYDHHYGWKEFFKLYDKNQFGCKFYINEGSPSCVSDSLSKYLLKDEIQVAEAQDTNSTPNELGRFVNSALKVDINNIQTKIDVLLYLLSRKTLAELNRKYKNIEESTYKLLQYVEYIHNQIAFVDTTHFKDRYDKTLLFSILHQNSKIAIVKSKSRHGDKFTVATGSTGINLLKLFNIASGNPSRITISELLDAKLKELLVQA